MTQFSAQFDNNFALTLSAYGEAVGVKADPSSVSETVLGVVQNPIMSAVNGTPWSEQAETCLVLIAAADVAVIAANESILTIRGEDWAVIRCDLGEGAVWRVNCGRADTAFSGRGRLG